MNSKKGKLATSSKTSIVMSILASFILSLVFFSSNACNTLTSLKNNVAPAYVNLKGKNIAVSSAPSMTSQKHHSNTANQLKPWWQYLNK